MLPVGLHTKTRYDLPRWDHYSLPFPYSHITMFVGEPLTIGKSEEIKTAGQRIATAINQAATAAKTHHEQR